MLLHLSVFAAGNQNDVFKAEVRIDHNKVTENVAEDGLASYIVERVAACTGGFFVAWALAAACNAKARRNVKKTNKRASRRLEGDPAYYSELLAEWQNRLSPTELVLGNGKTGFRNLVYSYFCYFLTTGAIRIVDEDNLEVVRRDGLTEEERIVLDFLDVEGDPEGVPDLHIGMEKLCEKIKTKRSNLVKFEREFKWILQRKVDEKLQGKEDSKNLESTVLELKDYCVLLMTNTGDSEELSDYSRLCLLVFSALAADTPFTKVGLREEEKSDKLMYKIRYKMFCAVQERYAD